MKKKGLSLIIAVVCLIALCVGYVCLTRYNAKQESAESEDTISVVDLKAENIQKISYLFDGEPVTFTKDGDDWKLDSDTAFAVDKDKVNSLISTIVSMTATRKIENVSDLKEYGLDAPGQTVTLTDQDGKEITLCWGSNNATTSDDYVYNAADSKTVYTVASSVQSTLSKSADDYEATTEAATTEAATEK